MGLVLVPAIRSSPRRSAASYAVVLQALRPMLRLESHRRGFTLETFHSRVSRAQTKQAYMRAVGVSKQTLHEVS